MVYAMLIDAFQNTNSISSLLFYYTARWKLLLFRGWQFIYMSGSNSLIVFIFDQLYYQIYLS